MPATLKTRLDCDIPADIVLKYGTIQPRCPSVFKVEETHIAESVEKRKHEFRTGRSLAREALEKLGIAPCAIPVGPNREPIWPAMVTGSISHCSSLGVVALGLRTVYKSIGVDIELNRPLPQNIPEMIFANQERDSKQGDTNIQNHDTLTFSAKETVFKCLFPVVGFYFDFKEVTLSFDAARRRFIADLPPRITQQIGITQLIGHYDTSETYILTIAHLELSDLKRLLCRDPF